MKYTKLQNQLIGSVESRIILELYRKKEKTYGTKISRDIETTFSHTVRTLEKLEEENIITKEKEGRKVYIELSGKGKDLAKLQQQTKNILLEDN